MGPKKVKELLKRYVEAITNLNKDPKFNVNLSTDSCRLMSISTYKHTQTIESVYVQSNLIILPEFLYIKGEKRVDEIRKMFSDDELIIIIQNYHHIGDFGDKIERKSPETPYKKGEIGDPFYRMFDEISKQ